MIGNIIRLFKELDNDLKGEALGFFTNEFNLENRKYALNAWIIGGGIPEEHQERVVLYLQNIVRVQSLKEN